MSNQKAIFIVGNDTLVDEYSSLCSTKGYKRVTKPTKTIFLALELTNISHETKQKNLRQLDKILPKNVPIISSSVTATVTEQNAWLKHPERLIGIGAFPTLLGGSLIEFATSGSTGSVTREAAEQFAASLGKSVAFVQDSIGLVMPRILCMLVNEACFAMMERVAEGPDIDMAMKLGTNYPSGPVEWAERIGAKHVHAVVSALHRHFGEERYRCASLLRKAALGNRLSLRESPYT